MENYAREFGFTAEQLAAVTSKAFDLLEAGDLDGSAVVLRGLLALDPTNAPIRAALGAVLHEQGRIADAEAEYNQALETDGGTLLALVNRGELRAMRGDKSGLDDLRRAAAIVSPLQARATSILRRFS